MNDEAAGPISEIILTEIGLACGLVNVNQVLMPEYGRRHR